MEMSNEILKDENDQKNKINTKSPNPHESNSENNNSKNQSSLSKNQKKTKFPINNISVIPLKETYNLRYSSNNNTYDNLDDNIKNIINDPKYNDEKRSKSAYSKKSFREKFELMKLKVPEIKNWNCDPTAEIIIHNLEQKIDILTYENFLLTKKIKELINNNKSLQLNLSQNILLLKSEQQFKGDIYKINQNKNNLNNKKKENKTKDKNKDADLIKQNRELKVENNKLKLSNENLAGNNMELNKIITELKNELISNQNKFEEELENNRIDFEKKLLELKEKNNEYNNNNNINNFNNSYDNNHNDNRNNNFNDNTGNENKNTLSSFDMNKYLVNEEQYKQLLEENEYLHKQLRILLNIEDDDINKYSSSFQDNNNYAYTPNKDTNNLHINDLANSNDNNINNNNQSQDLVNENYLLKQKIKSLNHELKKVTYENNRKLLKIQEKLNERELKKQIDMIKENNNHNINESNKEEELDRILNETLMNINDEDEESKRMISTIQGIKNSDKKRISQCLIINNKMKSLSEENMLLHNQLLSMKKDSNMNNNINYISSDLNKNNNKPHVCFCDNKNNESYDYLINALKIKDEIIMKYKDKSDEIENKYKELILENSKLKENSNKNFNKIEPGSKISNIKRERADGLEDYLLDKIVNNQKQVLGERAPRFEDNNYKYMSKSFQYQENNNNMNTMNNRYNNYHYRGTKMSNYE